MGGISGGQAPQTRVYTENLLVAWANLPGNIASAYMVEWLGRRRTLAACMVGQCRSTLSNPR